VQATDNNFVGGDVIPNYLEPYFFAKESYLSTFGFSFLNECLVLPWMHLFMFYLQQGINCLHVYIQLLAIRGYASLSLIELKIFTLLLC
jgi:hypothetical protein